MIESSDDDVPTYTPEENDQLSKNLLACTAYVDRGGLEAEPFSLALVCRLHAAVFEGVRGHAGRHRSAGFGSERLSFGPHRSSDRTTVGAEMNILFSRVNASIASHDENRDDERYEASALRLAVWAHAEMIRIHPFEDGNGRTGRLLMGAILVRLGLRQIPVEATKDEYILALNHYFFSGDLGLLIDLLLAVDAGY